jgi:dCTP deaminase
MSVSCMLLNDTALVKALEDERFTLTPFDSSRVQPSSIDMTLGNQFSVLNWTFPQGTVVDLREDNSAFLNDISVVGYLDLKPGEFALATTVEVLTLPNDLAARVEGKSSLGRLGLMVHITAGFIDPGFHGEVTLELVNLLPVPIRIYPGMPVAQLAVFEMTGEAANPYEGKYQGQTGPAQSRFHLNFPHRSRVGGHIGAI